MENSKFDKKILDSIAKRAHYLATQMIWLANNRSDKQKGDPKVGGHPAASSSALHIMGALHLVCKTGFDHLANKPHASPTDHAYNYLLNLFLKEDLSKLSLEECNTAMLGLRAFSKNGEPVFQSYHSAFDSDHHNFFPSGTVGIPPVNAGYMALAYRYAEKHGWKVPPAHFWAVMGDAEYREGSLFEAMPDFAERELGSLTWVVDYNRQSLDGHRLTHKEIMGGTDDQRIERTALANGWEVIQVRHGGLREKLFTKSEGDKFKKYLENDITDFELNAFMQIHNKKTLKEQILVKHPDLKKFMSGTSDDELFDAFHDMGGHDFNKLIEAYSQSKKNKKKPTLIIAHTIKGWGLKCAALQSNHSLLPDQDEVDALRSAQGISEKELFARFADSTPEGKFLKARGESLYKDILAQHEIKLANQKVINERVEKSGEMPNSFDINLKMASYPHTQWMLGQITSKLTRIANTPNDDKKLEKGQKPLDTNEKIWKAAAEQFVFMAPDVGTSTNLNPSMDGKIFNPQEVEDLETPLGVKDKSSPDLIPGEKDHDRFLRFDITEANTTSCQGSIGKMRDILGIPLFPLMTVYDFFIKRALDQFFYNLYWKSSFLLVGTPSGVSLSPEGAQHGWKSDFQIPNQVVWEPFYCIELDWIIADALKRHIIGNDQGRTGVHLRLTTRGVEQKEMIQRLRRHKRFKSTNGSEILLCPDLYPIDGATVESSIKSLSDEEILSSTRADCLSGGYYLVDYRGYKSYEPGDNVVNIFALGTLTTEALKASDELLKRGIYANVIVVTSTDLLVGNLAYENEYFHLRNKLAINGDLYLEPTLNGKLTTPEVITLSGRRVPVVSVHDGEPGLLDNIGSIIGTRHISLAVRKHSKCGRPEDVYKYHHIDWESVVDACGKALSETALEQVQISRMVVDQLQGHSQPQTDWRVLWPQNKSH